MRLATVLLVIAAGSALAQEPRDGPWPGWEASERTQVVLLGTGTPVVDSARFGPATAIVVDDHAYLVDAGPGIVRRAALAAETWDISGLYAEYLDRAFISHLHSDHTLGLPDLIFSPWVVGREGPLELYGPPGIEAMADKLVAAWDEDIEIRLEAESDHSRSDLVNAYDSEPGLVYQDARVRVEAIAVDHGLWEHAYGYRFTTPDRVIVISGDAVPSESLIAAAEGADMLIHEVHSDAGLREGSESQQYYHSTFHTSTIQLGEIARQAKPGLVVLYHQLYFGATDEELMEEMTGAYDGPVVSGRDLDKF